MNCQWFTASSPTQMISKIVTHCDTAQFILQITISNYSLYINTLLLVCGKCTEAKTLKSNVVHMGENDFYRTVCRNHVLEGLLIA
jgi:thymidine kinase